MNVATLQPMIRFDDVEKTFGSTTVLKGVSLDVMPGKTTVLIGASGSGKTTLLRCANGLERADRGRIFVAGQPMGRHLADGAFLPLPPRELRQRRAEMGMVFQRFNLFPHMTALENVVLGPREVRKLTEKEAQELAKEQLARVGLAAKAQSYPSQLSGGQQQRVAIARSLAMSPKVVLFDEPTSALDPIATASIEELIAELKERVTILIVTHNMQQAARVSDFTAYMYLGELIEFGWTDDVFIKPRNPQTEAYLTGRFG